MDMSAFCIVQTTIDDEVRAEDIAEALIERKLAACVQIAPVTSHYVWKGAPAKEKEFLLSAKARTADFPLARRRDPRDAQLPDCPKSSLCRS